MWTKPAGSPRGLTSQVPSAEEVASSMNGERSMNWRVSSLTLSLIFDWTTGVVEPITSRSSASVVIVSDTAESLGMG